MSDLTSLDDITPKPQPNAGCGILILIGILGLALSWLIVVIAAIKTITT
jgi:hypothetical protein